MTEWWDELAVAALLGTDRRPLSEFSFLPGKLGATATAVAGDPAAVLLDVAALAVGYRRGGLRAGTIDPGTIGSGAIGSGAIDPGAVDLGAIGSDRVGSAPVDRLPRAGRAAGARLAGLLQGRDLELLMIWCTTAAEAGRLAPPECLPELLDLAAKQPLLRPAVGRVLGERGRWLAGQRPAWAVAVRSEPSRAAALDPQAWPLGTPAQRAAWLRATRRAAPAAGVAALAGTWAKETGPHRAGFLALLAEGLGPADEALLETALDDRRQDVRTTAADLLAALPSSEYAGRMRSRAKEFVHPEQFRSLGMRRNRLVVDVPERLDPAAIRDGVTEVRPGARMTADSRSQWWLEQVIAATPLGAWRQLFETPEAALAHRFDEPWQQPIHAGWAWAAVRQRDRGWALALLGTRSRHRVEELLGVLDGADQVTVLRRRLSGLGSADVQVLARYLEVCPVPWPAPVAADVLTWLLARMPELHPRTAQPLLNLIAYRFPLAAGPAIAAAAEGLPLDHPWRAALRSAAHLISVRTRIHEELQ